jgi:5-methylthioadenosine/S-adenosylhomocysteine deaminase
LLLLEYADILIKNCLILPMDGRGIMQNGLIATKDTEITYAGPNAKAPKVRAENTVDATGMLASPGFINCHTHLPMTLLRGLAEDQPLQTWLTKTIWPLEAKLTRKDIHTGALLGCLELIRTGTTTFTDMYFQEEIIAKAAQTAGLRAVLAPGLLETLSKDLAEETLQETIRLAKEYHKPQSTISIQLGPHSTYTCTPQFLRKVRRTAIKHKVGIHIHLAENKEMAQQTQREHGKTEVELLDHLEFLGPDVLAAHCIHLTQKDMKILARHDVKVAYNPVANMKLAQGTPNIPGLQKHNITIGLGTDGPASNNTLDMLQTVKMAALLQKSYHKDPTILPAEAVLRMATVDAAKAVGLQATGSLTAGKKADIVLIDLKKPHLTPLHNAYATLVYSATGNDVHTLIADGKILMQNRHVKTLNEDQILENAQETAKDLIQR